MRKKLGLEQASFFIITVIIEIGDFRPSFLDLLGIIDQYLPSLQKQAPVDSPEPHDCISRLEISQFVAFRVKIHAQTFE